jgi:hypothetical protein
MLTGCGGSQPPITAPGTMPQSRSIAQQAARGKSWMLPEASGEDLLYVGAYDQSYQHGEVFIYSYSNQQLVGTLTGFANPEGLCVDAAGNVYVTDSSTTQRVYEYPHGGLKAKRTIETPGPPYGCGINPINGDLAIASLTGSGGVGQVYVYKRARGRPKTYSTPNIWRLFASSYDVSGNLFIIGYNEGSSGTIYKMAELPRGQAKLRIVNTHAIGHSFTDIKWDGQYLAVLSESNVYRVTVGGKKLIGQSVVSLPGDGYQFWPVPKYGQAIVTDFSDVASYSYPGGQFQGVLSPGPGVYGVTVSLSPSRLKTRH